MPSTYAHRVFGRRVLGHCPQEFAAVIGKNRQLYDIGLHGPDVLFYYRVLKNCPVNAKGYAMHARPAREFFERAKGELAAAADRDAALAYLFGFVCHFALDSACHGYIENKIAVSHVTHTEIESEFDRFLLEAEGKEPLSACLTDHIFATEENARVIAPFLGVTQKQAKKALSSMLFYNRLLRAPHQPKRGLVRLVLRLSGNFKEMHGMMIAKKPIPACADSNLRLAKLMKRAETDCIALLCDLFAYLKGEGELSPAFGATFGPPANWREIPVLSPEEEKNYEP